VFLIQDQGSLGLPRGLDTAKNWVLSRNRAVTKYSMQLKMNLNLGEDFRLSCLRRWIQTGELCLPEVLSHNYWGWRCMYLSWENHGILKEFLSGMFLQIAPESYQCAFRTHLPFLTQGEPTLIIPGKRMGVPSVSGAVTEVTPFWIRQAV
jgi:hypothetical protein